MKGSLGRVFPLLVGLALIVATGLFSGLRSSLEAVAGLDPAVLAPLCIVYGLSWVLRGSRLVQIISMFKSSIRFRDALGTELIADLANQVIPARLGDVTKIVYLAEKGYLRYPESIFSAFLVRALDLTALLFMALLCIPGLPSAGSPAGPFHIAVGALLFLACALAAWLFWFRTEVLLRAFIGPAARLRPHIRQLRSTLQGRGTAFARLFLTSLLIWVFDVMTLLVFLWSLGVRLGPLQTAFVLFASNLAKAIPFSPNGLGVYEGAMVLLLSGFGVERGTAFAVSILDHAFMNAFSIILALLALARLKMDFAGLKALAVRGGALRERGSGQVAPEAVALDEQVVPDQQGQQAPEGPAVVPPP